MEIKLIATTSPQTKDKEYFNNLSGKLAGICYMPHDFETLNNEDPLKTQKRATITKQNNHHSVFEHEYITLYLENVPKIFAMYLNNEKAYTTSEKSARYTKMQSNGIEEELYNKWNKTFVDLLTEKYKNEAYFTQQRIGKLAGENARYFLSIYTPTSLAYTTSYRQLNYLYTWFSSIDENSSEILKKLKPVATEFCKKLEDLNIIDSDLAKGGNMRNFSFEAKKDRQEYYGDVYSTKYTGSFASLAQAQRHRTINYEYKTIVPPQYYIPKLIKNDIKLVSEWISDMEKVKDLTPQGELIEIYERGTPENLILKARERLCTSAQLEVMEQTKNTITKYISSTQDVEIKKQLTPLVHRARCVNGYKCNQPCKFKDGINLEREI